MASGMQHLSHKGRPTGGIYAAVRSVHATLVQMHMRDLGPVYWFSDAGRAKFRTKLFPGYKGQREKARAGKYTPEQYEVLRTQLPVVEEFARALGCVHITFPGREADDLIAYAVKRFYLSKGYAPVVLSGDRDLWQLESADYGEGRGTANVWDLNLGRYVEDRDFRERFGVDRDLFPLYKSILGDTSDNIPGVSGVGEKTVAEFLDRNRRKLTNVIHDTGLGSLPTRVRTAIAAVAKDAKGKRETAIVEAVDHLAKVAEAVQLDRPRIGRAARAHVRRLMSTPGPGFDSAAFAKLRRDYGFVSLTSNAPELEPVWTAVNAKPPALPRTDKVTNGYRK
jgi:5'-3' exonuclease